jgi:hypothetical protein
MRTFEEFKQERYQEAPYDLASNPYGFNRLGGSDISAHLPFLEYLAGQCSIITEFGTRDCYSTAAFIAGCYPWPTGTVYSYDVITTPAIEELNKLELPCNWIFNKHSSIQEGFKIRPSDLLFIDTDHTYEQVQAELQHASLVKKYIVFHDTFSFPAIVPAINEFLDKSKGEWKKVYEVKFNHGLTVLERSGYVYS